MEEIKDTLRKINAAQLSGGGGAVEEEGEEGGEGEENGENEDDDEDDEDEEGEEASAEEMMQALITEYVEKNGEVPTDEVVAQWRDVIASAAEAMAVGADEYDNDDEEEGEGAGDEASEVLEGLVDEYKNTTGAEVTDEVAGKWRDTLASALPAAAMLNATTPAKTSAQTVLDSAVEIASPDTVALATPSDATKATTKRKAEEGEEGQQQLDKIPRVEQPSAADAVA
jgi:hypothetical protein